MSEEATPGPVVDVEWLAANRGREDVHVVDVRDGWEYEGIGHVPGAVNLPFDEFRGSGGADAGMLPGPDRFAELAGRIGLERGDLLVAYDDEHGVFAARLLVTAVMYGHPRIALLDGDYTAWSREQRTTTEPTSVTPTEYPASVPDDRPLVDAGTVRAAIGSDAVLVDTRTPEEFAAGHIAGAINFDWRELVDPDSRGLKSRGALTEVLAGYGVTPDRRVILYCNTARRISHTYIVLRHLGYPDVDFYEGSLTDWRERGYELVGGSEGDPDGE